MKEKQKANPKNIYMLFLSVFISLKCLQIERNEGVWEILKSHESISINFNSSIRGSNATCRKQSNHFWQLNLQETYCCLERGKAGCFSASTSTLIDFQCCLIYSSEVSVCPVTPTFVPSNPHCHTNRIAFFPRVLTWNLDLGLQKYMQMFCVSTFLYERYLDMKHLLGNFRMIVRPE